MSEQRPPKDLEPAELDALCAAALWYAKYRAADIAEQAGDRSAAAVVAREEYLHLVMALRKLGVRVRVPDALVGLAAA